jgi:hypothetical protein
VDAARETENVVPFPGWLCTAMVAPWRCAILRQIANPIPLPSYSLRPCNRWNGRKIFSVYAGSKPIPLSVTDTSQRSPDLIARTVMRGVDPGA